ncbi:MAG: hypothetical protein ACI81P_003715 [Neolewinella sp.]
MVTSGVKTKKRGTVTRSLPDTDQASTEGGAECDAIPIVPSVGKTGTNNALLSTKGEKGSHQEHQKNVAYLHVSFRVKGREINNLWVRYKLQKGLSAGAEEGTISKERTG